jgi:putative ABC transport system substrate-binding protein
VGSELDRDETLAAARTLGIEPLLLEAQPGPALGGLFEAALHEHVGAVLVLPGAIGAATRIAELAAASHLPTMCPQRDFVTVGCMMSYGPHYPTIFGRVAVYVDKILKGTSPADLPVEQPMTFEFVVNMNTARELGITFPNEILLQVTEVIE